MARAIGAEGHEVLEKLATARRRLVLLEEHEGQQVHFDRLVQLHAMDSARR